jgi:cysteine sulfinate desulfinase/cysteine desulfurase-like protein
MHCFGQSAIALVIQGRSFCALTLALPSSLISKTSGHTEAQFPHPMQQSFFIDTIA